MKKILFTALTLIAIRSANAQTAVGPIERKMTDSLCAELKRLDISQITTKEEAVQAYTNCVMKHADMLPDLAAEKKVDMADQAAMRLVGIDLGKNLMREKCDVFMQLSVIMAKNKALEIVNATTGKFKRIENKGFNYIIISDESGSERPFLWLRQFPGSEKFSGSATRWIGKRFRITAQEIEVYLPAAKGYYKVKEITGIEVL